MLPHFTVIHNHAALAFSIFLLAFAYEDGATLLAVTLTMTGRLDPRLGFASAFLGIWGGDMGLYLVGAKLSAKIAESNWTKRFVSPESFAKAQTWFSSRGKLTIVICRFIPGSRLPVYVAAGALKQPARTFGILTGICAIVWVSAIFAVPHFRPLARLSPGKSFAACAVALLVGPGLLAKLFRSAVPKARLMFRKYRRWEFWPAWMFYPPVVAMYAWLSIKYRGLALPTVANPSFRNGGIVGESKIGILRALMSAAPAQVADGYLVPAGPLLERIREFQRISGEHAMQYPVVLKPNLGQRGAGFKLVSSRSEAGEYLTRVKADVIVQRYVPHEKEIGIFYYRIPGQQRGEIFAVTEKIFPAITGDGASTLEQLIMSDERASLIASTYLDRFPQLHDRVLQAGACVRLVEAGNHCQGCIFRDGNHLLSEALTNRIDEISKRLPGFFIGRYDIRYASVADLAAGNFTIIELNGAASEATNIYDERNSLLEAYKTLYAQWELVFRIGSMNRDRGYNSATVFGVLRDARLYAAISQSYPAAD